MRFMTVFAFEFEAHDAGIGLLLRLGSGDLGEWLACAVYTVFVRAFEDYLAGTVRHSKPPIIDQFSIGQTSRRKAAR